MSLYKQFGMDADKERDGVDVKYGANKDGSVPTFRIRRAVGTNQRYAKTVAHEVKPFRRLLALDALDAATARRVNLRIFCQAILVSWDNVQDEKGNPFVFSFDNAMKLMEDLPELFDDLNLQSNNAALFKAETLEDDAKNS